MRKIKVLFYLPNLAGGGAERVVVNLINSIDTNRYEVVLVLVEKSGVYLELISESTQVIGLNSSRILFSIIKLRQIILSFRPDIVFSSLFLTNIALYISTLGLSSDIKMILRSPNSPRLILENNKMSWLVRYLLERAYSKANVVLAQTPEMRIEIEQFHRINKNKILVFMNPLDEKYIDVMTKKNPSSPFDSKHHNVIAAGRLHRQKGFDVLIEAFSKVIERDRRYRLHIIGDDKGEEKKLFEKVQHLGLQEYVNFLGFQKNPYRYFFHANLFVLSSRWEGLPNALLENLYLKKPVVVTSCISFMDQLVTHGENGFVVEVDNADQMADAIVKYEDIVASEFTFGSDINTVFDDLIGEEQQ